MAQNEQTAPYRVLARKYRPASFAGLIGQDAMVRTLKNAIASGRLAHAFILTGVRGVGKTTTARIIARALNCVGPDGTGGPTVEPCGECEHCRAITDDRHVDVIEMDAASRTGVEDIRDLIEGARYRPVSARYKIYIIDEVHMLSKSAFNALLKTLEEPPEHVKFIFATTEVRRVPVTVLSRCQRFDLRRVDPGTLSAHLAEVAEHEGIAVEPEALALIARAADGSVRDGLSLLDTAMAHGAESGREGGITAAEVRDMMGLADRTRVLDLFDHLMAGEVAPALEILDELYAAGADPAVVLQDLLEFCHTLTRFKIAPEETQGPEAGQAERARGREMAAKLSIPTLTRAWQMLLKGLGEVHAAASPIAAAEMALVRLAYAAELPPPAELVRELTGAQPGPDAARGVGGADPAARPGATAPPREQAFTPADAGAPADAPLVAEPPAGSSGAQRPQAALAGGAAQAAEPAPCGPLAEPAATPVPEADFRPAEAGEGGAEEPRSFEEVVALFAARREAILHAHLMADVHLVRFEPGRIEFRPGPGAPANLANRLGELLHRWTGRRWVVSVSGEEGAPTLRQQAEAAAASMRREAAAHPAVRAILEAFPGATIEAVRARSNGDSPTPGRGSNDGDESP